MQESRGWSLVAFTCLIGVLCQRSGASYVYTHDEANRLIEVRDSSANLLSSYSYDALGRRVIATIGTVTTRYYYDGQNVIEEYGWSGSAETGRLRYHVNGTQFIDERVATFDDATTAFTYYLLKENFSVAGTGNADGSTVERLDYSATGSFAGSGGGIDVDYNDDGYVDADDLTEFEACASGPAIPQNDPNCAGMKLDADVDVDQDDLGIFQRCYSGDQLALPECTGQGGGLPASGTFVMHGRPVDVLPDGHTLLFVRARYYDLKHGRWLQRDPSGFADGPNLYEAFGTNAMAATDPTGLYYKLWSTWENGAEVYWQDINPIGWWLTNTVSSELPLGQYQYVDGHKFVTYRGSVLSDPLDPAFYLIPFENLEGWAKQDISLSAYERSVFQNGIPIDRDGKVLKRNLLAGGLTQMFMALQEEQERRFKELANWATTPFGTRTVEMLLSGGVDPITERNMTGRDVREHIVRLAQTGAAIYVGGRLLTVETGAMTVTAGRGSAIVGKPVRCGPHIKGPLPEEIANTFRGGSYTQTTL